MRRSRLSSVSGPVLGPVLGPMLASTLLAGLLGAGVASAAPAPSPARESGRTAAFAKLGSTHGLDRVLRPGCQTYLYSYHIKPPTPNWGFEVFVTDPRHHGVASNAFIAGDDKVDGKARFRLCKRITVAGVFHIRGKLTYSDGDVMYEGFVPTSKFRLCRPPKHPGRFPCSKAQQTP